MRAIENPAVSRQDARPVRRVALLLALPVALATPSAAAREQAGCAQVSGVKGPAPFAVSFTASCAAAADHWDFGDRAGAVGAPLAIVTRLVPASAGAVSVRIWKNGTLRVSRTYPHGARIRLDSARITAYRVAVSSVPRPGFARTARVLSIRLFLPTLRPGASGPTVARLVSTLASLHYAVRRTGSFGPELVDSLYAFQKVQGLPRTGVADAATWRALAHPRLARPRYSSPADHLEIDKGHQVLYVVRSGSVALIVPVSTAGIAGHFTPEGHFAIYRKVTGFDPSPLGTLFDPMYFTGGPARRGGPSRRPHPPA